MDNIDNKEHSPNPWKRQHQSRWESFNPWVCVQEILEACLGIVWKRETFPILILSNQIGRNGPVLACPSFHMDVEKSTRIPFTASRKFLPARSVQDIWNPFSLTPGHIYLL